MRSLNSKWVPGQNILFLQNFLLRLESQSQLSRGSFAPKLQQDNKRFPVIEWDVKGGIQVEGGAVP